MNKRNEARKYNSSKIQELLDEVTPLEMEQTKVKMQLAANIEDLMQAKGWSKSQFAEKVGKNPSEITKWLSGTQNFTTDVLTIIAYALGVELSELFGEKQKQETYRMQTAVKSTAYQPVILFYTPWSESPNRFGSYHSASQVNSLDYRHYQKA